MINDINVLVSVINTKLRDTDEDFEDICFDLEKKPEEVLLALSEAGYCFDSESRRIKQK